MGDESFIFLPRFGRLRIADRVFRRILLDELCGWEVQNSIKVALHVPMGAIARLWKDFIPGTSPMLILATGGGMEYTLNPIVVPDSSAVLLGGLLLLFYVASNAVEFRFLDEQVYIKAGKEQVRGFLLRYLQTRSIRLWLST